jgi:hypothetical protein
VQVLEYMRLQGVPVTGKAYDAAVAACAACGRFDEAVDLVTEARTAGCRVREVTCASTARACIAGQAPHKAAAVLRPLVVEGSSPPSTQVCVPYLVALAQDRGEEGATAALEEMMGRGLALSPAFGAAALAMTGDICSPVDTVAVWNALRSKGCHLSDEAHEAVIIALGRLGRSPEVVHLLRIADSPGCAVFKTAIKACGQSNDALAAVEVARRAREVLVREGEAGNVLTVLLRQSVRAGDTGPALKLVEEWVPLPDVIAYGAAIDAYGKAGAWRRSLELLEAMPLPPNATIYTSAADACARAGRWEEAVRLLPRLARQGLAAETALYTTCVGAAGAAGLGPVVCYLFEEMALLGVGDKQAVAVAVQALQQAGSGWADAWAPFVYGRGVECGLVEGAVRGPGGKTLVLDLHRFSKALARAAVAKTLQDLGNGALEEAPASCLIVTGQGRQMKKDAGPVKEAVQALLRERGIKGPWTVPGNPGALKLLLKKEDFDCAT